MSYTRCLGRWICYSAWRAYRNHPVSGKPEHDRDLPTHEPYGPRSLKVHSPFSGGAIIAEEAHDESEPVSGLSDNEVEAVAQRKAGSAKVVHEVIRLQGDEELDRPWVSLLFSAFAAGVAISASIIAEASLSMRLPDSAWRELVIGLGYPVGFVLVILGNLQLFTENTVTAVLPLSLPIPRFGIWDGSSGSGAWCS